MATKRNQRNIALLSLLLSATLFTVSCKDEEVDAEEENELITTVKLNFTSGGTYQLTVQTLTLMVMATQHPKWMQSH